jgi:YVTN family beta-propeller protein
VARYWHRRLAFLAVASLAGAAGAAAADVTAQRIAVSEATFDRPHDLALSPDGRFLYVSDVGNDVVKVLDPATLETVGTIGADVLSSPHDVAFDTEGRLLVADSGNDRIVVFRVDGTTGRKLAVWDKDMSSPEGVAVAPDGTVYVTNAGSDTVMALVDGRIRSMAGTSGSGRGQYRRPHDVDVDAAGRVFVVDPGNNRIQLLDERLRVTESLSGAPYNFNEPKYVAFDGRGWLWVADEYNNQVKVFDEGGRPVLVIGDGRAGTGPGRLRKPEGVTVAGDHLWIADTYNDRILLYRLSGAP